MLSGDTPASIQAERFGWTYGSRTQPALEGLTFAVPAGSALLVIGPSGSGKSTLARALAGLVPHALPGTWRGRLRVDDADVSATAPARLGARVGLVFQDPESQLVMPRVEDEVAFGLENRGWPRTAMLARVPGALTEVGLGGFGWRSSRALSGGEQQRLALADVLAPLPGLLVFDEPTAYLDPPGRLSFFDRLAALVTERRQTIVIVEHDLESALPLADLVLVLDDRGRQVAFGSGPEVEPWIAPLRETVVACRDRDRSDVAAVIEGVPPAAMIDGLVIRYGAESGGTREALHGLSVRLETGRRVALVGPNGSGKSSLLFALAGARRPAHGTVHLIDTTGGAEDPVRIPSARMPDLIGLAFQDPELGFLARRVDGEVAIGAGPGAEARDPRVGDALTRFGLAELADQDPFRLSRGQQRRLSIAAFVVRPPRLLLLDEPTYGLDQQGRAEVLTLLDEGLAAGQAQLLATHDPRLVPACDRVLALDAGRLVFDGSPARFLAAPPYEPAAPWRSRA